MLDFSWKIFSMTGDLDMYLLIKELERDSTEADDSEVNETIDSHMHQS